MTSNVSFLSKFDQRKSHRYAVILAGGEGTRLRSLTRLVAGDERPKQFCPILGDETLLDRTRRRIAAEIAPENTLYSLTRKHERYYRHALVGVSPSQQVVQPESRGTAPAILYSLMRIAKDAPDAIVGFFPSDHYFSDDAALMSHVDTAFGTAAINTDSIVLLGIEPEKAETSYGWIEPVNSLFGDLAKGFSRVNRFWEKPTRGVAEQLLNSRCLWNSFIMVGRATTFISMFRENLPEMYRMFATAQRLFGTSQEDAVIRSIYSWIDDTNFSSQLLEATPNRLLVMRVSEVGWSDWGEPERVIGTLNTLGLQPQWMHAMAA